MIDRDGVEGKGGQACHVPVMVEEARQFLITPHTRVIVDATVGLGGHAEALLAAAPAECLLIGVDLDDVALGLAADRLAAFGERAVLMKMNFGDLADKLPPRLLGRVDAMLVDCGISGLQIVSSDRGFSFDRDGVLDMRFDRSAGRTALSVLNTADLGRLTELFRHFGEKRCAGKLARSITAARERGELKSTLDLARAVKVVVARQPARSLARVFLAIRATVNDELENLTRLLDSLPDLLASGGRVCTITYHSLEDRVVKTAFRRLSGKCVCPPGSVHCTCGVARVLKVLTPRPLEPRPEEISANASARSAKMRVAEKM